MECKRLQPKKPPSTRAAAAFLFTGSFRQIQKEKRQFCRRLQPPERDHGNKMGFHTVSPPFCGEYARHPLFRNTHIERFVHSQLKSSIDLVEYDPASSISKEAEP